MSTIRRIHLLRHAKSDWHGDAVDHDRPLARRGVRACASLARHLDATAVSPDLVLCSSALRARETFDGIRDGLPADVEVEVDRELYGAAAWTLLDRLRSLPDEVSSVLLIGHNPGIGELAAALPGRGAEDALGRVRSRYPTGALASLDFEGPWAAIGPGTASLAAFIVPRELE